MLKYSDNKRVPNSKWHLICADYVNELSEDIRE